MIENLFEEQDRTDALALNSVCMLLGIMPAAAIRRAIAKIERVETVGPLFDPTAFIEKPLFDNAREWKQLLHHLAEAATIIQRNQKQEAPATETA